MQQQTIRCGIDFGTSNSVVTVLAEESNEPQIIVQEPSVIYFPKQGICESEHYIGNEAISQYLIHGMVGRFIQSVKSLLPDASFAPTLINKRPYCPDDLTALILDYLKWKAESTLGIRITSVVMGRPVFFSENIAHDRLAEKRLRNAARMAGFREVRFQYEPVAAAYSLESQIRDSHTVLVVDIGAGTTDLTIMKLGVDSASSQEGSSEVLATDGIHIGGDDFDSAIMKQRVISHFGHKSVYESWGKELEVPEYIFRTICRWEMIPFIKSPQLIDELRYIRAGSQERNRIENLITLIEQNLGYTLFQSIESSKIELSQWDVTELHFTRESISIKERITEPQFNNIILDNVMKISHTVKRAQSKAGISSDDIDTVLLTGGSSQVRALVKLFVYQFGQEKVKYGEDVFTHVACGLALSHLKE